MRTKTPKRTISLRPGRPVAKAPRSQLRNIKRRAGGWLVEVRRRSYCWRKYFAWSIFGGQARALEAARKWRDERIAATSGPAYEVWKRERPQARNTTGTIGVFRSVHRSSRRGVQREYWYWQALWVDLEGRRRTRTFGVAKFGERAARRLAYQARKDALAEIAADAAMRRADPRRTPSDHGCGAV